jgi:hypothetical protein
MKKSVIVLLLLNLFLQLTVSAKPVENILPKMQKAFLKNYPGAQHAKWEALDDKELYVVRFVYRNEIRLAYFNTGGSLVASCRAIQMNQLPSEVQRAIGQISYITDIIKAEELLMYDEQIYFFEILKNKRKMQIQISSDGIVHEIKKQ